MTVDGQRYKKLANQLQLLGKQISKKEMERVSLYDDERVYLSYPQFAFDACILSSIDFDERFSNTSTDD